MQFRLRTLLIMLAVGPVVLAGAYFLAGRLCARPIPWAEAVKQATHVEDYRIELISVEKRASLPSALAP